MPRRAPKLTLRKKSKYKGSRRQNRGQDGLNDDGGEPSAPDNERWNRMRTYRLFAINDESGNKFSFHRNAVATILPEGKNPGDSIEPHEYWVGKIIEIRADAGSEDSEEVWTKVQWFYSAQDAAPLLGSFDISSIGTFERLLSNHWDYVAPQAFNEVIPMPKLFTFRRPANSITSSKHITKGKGKRKAADEDGEKDDSETGGDEDGLESQPPIGPETFYWRYRFRVEEDGVAPNPNTRICLCSTPYRPNDTSPLTGIMLFCPRPSCRTSYHLGCLQKAKSVWVDSEVIVPHKKVRRENKGTAATKVEGRDDIVRDEQSDARFGLTERAIRLLCSSPDMNDDIDLLGLVRGGSGSGKEILGVLQKFHDRQSQPQTPSKSTTPAKMPHVATEAVASAAWSAGSVVEVEDLLVEGVDSLGGITTTAGDTKTRRSKRKERDSNTNNGDSISHLTHSRPQKRVRKTSPLDSPSELSPSTLLSTLLLLSSPLPSTSNTNNVPNTNASPAQSTSNQVPEPNTPTQPTATTNYDFPFLLKIASQPLFRGTYSNSSLGPTGNVNVVLRARRLVWDALRALGDMDLSGESAQQQQVVVHGSFSSPPLTPPTLPPPLLPLPLSTSLPATGAAERKDEDDLRKIRECVDGAWKDWRAKLSSVLAAGEVIEDTVVVGAAERRRPAVPTAGGGTTDSAPGASRNNDRDPPPPPPPPLDKKTAAKKAEESRRRRLNARMSAAYRIPRKRPPVMKKEAEKKDLFGVDWACPGCGSSI